MGLFSKKKKIFVSSVAYNLAGDEKDRVQFLPTTVITKIVSNNNFSMADTLQSALLNGPGIRMRSFARWARETGYTDAIGQTAGRLQVGDAVDALALAPLIPHGPGETVNIQSAEVGNADYAYWSDQWMLENHPERVDADYEVDFSETLNTVYIKFADGTQYSFNPVGFDPAAEYLYAHYSLTSVPAPDPVAPGVTVPVGSPSEFPDTTGWDLDSNTSTPGSMTLNTTVKTVVSYSDARPNEESTVVIPSTERYTAQEAVFSKVVFLGQGLTADELVSEKTYQHNMRTYAKKTTVTTTSSDETIAGGVIKTTTVTTTTESLDEQFSYRRDTQRIVDKKWSVLKVLIYQYGTGNPAYDALFTASGDSGAFLPFIPMRQDNVMISNSYMPDIYAKNKKAYKKALGSDYDKLVTSIKTNPSIGDIDYAYVVFGVSVNTKEQASLKYIYKFFQTLIQQGAGGSAGYDAWQTAWAIADTKMRAWVDWKEAQVDPTNPLFGTAEPARIAYPRMPTRYIQVPSGIMNYNMVIGWSAMSETTFSGVGRPGAKTGDVWWTAGATVDYDELVYSAGVVGADPYSNDFASITWQDSANTYRTIAAWGLKHYNGIYRGKGVDTHIGEALRDPEVSGFIVPLNEGVFRSMSLVDATQMSQGNAYMVFNCYKVVKQKWYQTGWFKIIIVIVAIVIAVVTVGTGSPVSAGLLGTAAAVGASLGFTGLIAVIVGTVANAVAAMILTQIIMMGANAIFGEKVGAIVGAIASVVAISVGSGMASGQEFSSSFNGLISAENLTKLTLSAGGGISEFLGLSAKETLQATQELMDDYKNESKNISDLYEQNLGYGQAAIDPLVLTDTTWAPVNESSNSFLSRTLMTGTDIANMTSELLANFTNVTLSTELT